MKRKEIKFVRVQRIHSSDVVGTYGSMYLPTEDFYEPCIYLKTLEPSTPVIPVGIYDLKLTYSPKFSKKVPYCSYKGVPLVCGVTGHSGIRIHVGNYKRNTEGCILVGLHFNGVSLLKSAAGYHRLLKFLSDPSYDYKIVIGDDKKSSYDLYLDYCLNHPLENMFENEKEEDLPF